MEESAINYWGFVVGIIGLFLAIYSLAIQIKSAKKKEPVYIIRSRNLIRDSIAQYQNLSVLYSNKQVKSFTVSKVLFYNKGSDIINREDIVIHDQIKIVPVDNVKILGSRVLQTTKSANQFNAIFKKTQNCVLMNFEYLAKDDGAVIEVMHTGVSSADLLITGVIKDVQQIKRMSVSRKSIDFLGNFLFEGRYRFLLPVGIATYLLLVICVSIWQIVSIDTLNAYRHLLGLTRDVSVIEGVTNLIITFIMSVLFASVLVPFYRSRMKSAPKGLEIYDGE